MSRTRSIENSDGVENLECFLCRGHLLAKSSIRDARLRSGDSAGHGSRKNKVQVQKVDSKDC